MTPTNLPPTRDKLLFTPGPLTTSPSVKEAMLHDAGSWHGEFNAKVQWVRDRILQVAGLSRETGWETILLQGSGTFGVEAVLATCVPPNGKVAVLANGAYGERIVLMLQHLNIPHRVLRSAEHTPNDPGALDQALTTDPAITHVAIVHCETTTGLLNPIAETGRVVKRHGRRYLVDAMSSFGAIPIDIADGGIDFLVSSANKCIEGVPGFSFVICQRSALLACEGYARSLSLNLLDQLKGFERTGQFRYTPPTHAILAFEQALNELEQEGGVAGRGERYRQNHEKLTEGMKRMGFRPYLDPSLQSYIISSFHYPDSERFDFDAFYHKLSDKGFLIYPGKITQAKTFRIGSIGRIFPKDICALLSAIESTLQEMEIKMI